MIAPRLAREVLAEPVYVCIDQIDPMFFTSHEMRQSFGGLAGEGIIAKCREDHPQLPCGWYNLTKARVDKWALPA